MSTRKNIRLIVRTPLCIGQNFIQLRKLKAYNAVADHGSELACYIHNSSVQFGES